MGTIGGVGGGIVMMRMNRIIGRINFIAIIRIVKIALMMKIVMLFTIENWLKTIEERQMNGLLQS